MEKWLEKISNNSTRYIGLFLVAILLFLLCLHILFKTNAGTYWFEAVWSAGDILSFCGTILSFIGTIILGCVTAKISIDNNKINRRLAEIESKRELLEEDRRLGYIIPTKFRMNFTEISKVQENNSTEYVAIETEKCTDKTTTIYFYFDMKLTSESIINRVYSICFKMFENERKEDIRTHEYKYEWSQVCDRNFIYTRGVNQIDNTFSGCVMFSKYDTDIDEFEKLKKFLMSEDPFMICIDFEYMNTLSEKRKEKVQMYMYNGIMIRSELIL